MKSLPFLAFLLALAGAAAAQQRPVGTIVIQQTTVLRVPVLPHPPIGGLIDWREDRGPRCVPLDELAAAMLAGPGAVDFVTRDRRRFRARTDDDCTALDFYDGFYVQSSDARLCARRDEIRSRMGASCRIRGFSRLIPTPRR